jgi:hypothetical protein
MLDPLHPLFQGHPHGLELGVLTGAAADPDSARALTIAGLIMIAGVAVWSIGGLGAAVWLWFSNLRESRRQRGRSFDGHLNHS